MLPIFFWNSMTMNLMRAGSISALGLLLFAAIGCIVAASSYAQGTQINQETQAVCGDYNSFVAGCQSYCIGTCTNGSMIGACMSTCMGGYCSAPPSPPAYCSDPSQAPQPPQRPVYLFCDSDYLGWCQNWCQTCTQGSVLTTCLNNCSNDYCSQSPPAQPPMPSYCSNPSQGPQPPQRPVQLVCDNGYLSWCTNWCRACTETDIRGGCLADCRDDYCNGALTPSCRQQNSQTCTAGCSIVPIQNRAICMDQCFEIVCPNG